MQNTNPPAIKKLTATRPKGAGTLKAIKISAKDGPMKAPMIYSMLHNWPLARSNAAEGTIDGDTDWPCYRAALQPPQAEKPTPIP